MPEFILWFLVFLYHIQLVWSKMNVLAYTINHGFILSMCPIQYHLLCSPVFQNGVEQQCWKGNSQKDCIYGGEKNWFFILVRLIQGPLSYTISTWRISKAHRVTLNKQKKKAWIYPCTSLCINHSLQIFHFTLNSKLVFISFLMISYRYYSGEVGWALEL